MKLYVSLQIVNLVTSVKSVNFAKTITLKLSASVFEKLHKLRGYMSTLSKRKAFKYSYLYVPRLFL